MSRLLRSFSAIACTSLLAALPVLATAPEKAPSFARNFAITEHPTHRILTVRNIYRGSTGALHYALVPRNASLPDLPPDTVVIRTPVERVVTMETVHIGFLGAIGHTDAIVGTATADSVSHPGVRERLQAGDITRIESGRNIDVEALLLLKPDLILTTVLGDPAFDLPPELGRSGLPVVITAGYMEDHPLARAEWIRFVSAFFDASEQAEAFFAGVARRYTALQEKGQAVKERPRVFCGAPYSGTWYVPGGRSFAARFISHAGGDYLWNDDRSKGGVPLDTERVFLKAGEAEVWLNPSHYERRDELRAADPRFEKFRAFREGEVFNRTRRAAGSDRSAFWETGVVRPDEVLADHIRILHPELLPGHELAYYERLP